MFMRFPVKILKIFILLFILSFLFSNKSYAGMTDFVVYPQYLEINYGNNSDTNQMLSKVIYVENLGKQPYRIKVYTENWDLDDTGGLVYDTKPNDFYLSPYLKFNPREFEIQPGQRRMVRVSALNIPLNKPGEYRTLLYFESDLPRKDLNVKTGISINYKARFGIVVYAYVGSIDNKIKITDLKTEKDTKKKYITFNLTNEGNVHAVVSGKLKLVSDTQTTTPLELEVQKNLILPGRNRIVKMELPTDKIDDKATYKVLLKLNHKTPDKKIEYTTLNNMALKDNSIFTTDTKAVQAKDDDKNESKGSNAGILEQKDSKEQKKSSPGFFSFLFNLFGHH